MHEVLNDEPLDKYDDLFQKGTFFPFLFLYNTVIFFSVNFIHL